MSHNVIASHVREALEALLAEDSGHAAFAFSRAAKQLNVGHRIAPIELLELLSAFSLSRSLAAPDSGVRRWRQQ